MPDFDYKITIAVLCICLAIGGVIDYYSDFYWLTAGLIIQACILINGLIIGVEDKQSGGWDYNENESEESKREFKLSQFWLFIYTLITIGAAIWSA